ncbi:alpha-mannosidase [Bacillus sp. Marseille-Q3570]|uniref:glycoside hydrolase family 38 N-terminal domain-containing protein n=1 Tax=Bacillus sp. Marseille-Q3570 TaxID=2963522 RepID=UPI0021B75210|nr:alpha-mannosidase [Bacillus sp. Marseille-Q3570]
MKQLHLVCNAHLDPAWLWELEEGAGEALSTFRIAADFCENSDGFVFNHNEVLLYEWVEEFDPVLFRRIQTLVQQGKWHIMGGWFIQPDCNLPSGESFIRQIHRGRNYFQEKFQKRPKTAINFDSFGHTRGLVQILAKSGYDSYIVCRPDQKDCPLPGEDFTWVGYEGSKVIGHRAFNAYLSGRGKAHEKIKKWLEVHNEKETGLLLWGIGNHGGGPSRVDLNNIGDLQRETKEFDILHSTPEAYFDQLIKGADIPVHKGDLNPWAPGCYTSQIRIKQKHRQLENALYKSEKMISAAAILGLIEYPESSFLEAEKDLLTAQFHDILAGTSIKAVEDNAIRMMDHGLEILAREQMKAFFALTKDSHKADEGELPIFVFNPHPYPVETIVECEFQLPKPLKNKGSKLTIYSEGEKILSQLEEEESSLYIDWRKKVAFKAYLKPGQMNRFNCLVEAQESVVSAATLHERNGNLVFENDELEVWINLQTGLIDKYLAHGQSYLMKDAFLPIVIEDDEDAWGSHVKSFPNKIGQFSLVDHEEAKRVSGISGATELQSVRVIEDGAVRTIIEAVFEYNDSYIFYRYKMPKSGTAFELEMIVHWFEKDKMLKLSIPTTIDDGKYIGQVAFGTEELPEYRKEAVSQKWSSLQSENSDKAFSCINDGIYGSDVLDGEIRLSLIRSSAYSALKGGEQDNVLPQNRYSQRFDQGERHFSFRFEGSPVEERVENVSLEAMIHNEKPYVLSYFPSGEGMKPKPFLEVDDKAVELSAFKKASNRDEAYVFRLFETTGSKRNVHLTLPLMNLDKTIEMKGFEVKTFLLDTVAKTLSECNLLEEQIEVETGMGL